MISTAEYFRKRSRNIACIPQIRDDGSTRCSVRGHFRTMQSECALTAVVVSVQSPDDIRLQEKLYCCRVETCSVAAVSDLPAAKMSGGSQAIAV